ncbi:MAG TPA: ABC transporter ATP-binding protein, partial [Polyangiaceae bacterium]|nr:ABC transporter ATP-binding protein [Polyangiaceae bacterium]
MSTSVASVERDVVPSHAPAIVEAIEVRKVYQRGKEDLVVLQDLNLTIHAGAFEALMGPSGSGKSTLLNLIAGLDRPSSGTIRVAGADVGTLPERERAKWRAANIGFIFQTYNMMPVLTALENVELPLLLARLSGKERRERARTALSVVGLADRMQHYPRELSGGQEQRVAIARAIVADPKLLLCDEPTGDLDRKAGDEILDLLETLNRDYGKTIVMVTHDPHAADRARRTLHLEKG